MGKGKIAAAFIILIVIGIIFWPQIRVFIDRVVETIRGFMGGTTSPEPTTYPDVKFTDYDFNSAFTWGGTWIRVDLNVTVTNQGDAHATGVQATARLYEGASIKGEQTQYLGSLSPNQSFTTSFSIDGELLHYYRLWFKVSGNEGTFHTVQTPEFQLFFDIDWLQIIDAIIPF